MVVLDPLPEVGRETGWSFGKVGRETGLFALKARVRRGTSAPGA